MNFTKSKISSWLWRIDLKPDYKTGTGHEYSSLISGRFADPVPTFRIILKFMGIFPVFSMGGNLDWGHMSSIIYLPPYPESCRSKEL